MKISELLAAAMLASVLAITLSGCETDGPAEEAGEEIDDAIDDAGDAIDDAIDDADDDIDDRAGAN